MVTLTCGMFTTVTNQLVAGFCRPFNRSVMHKFNISNGDQLELKELLVKSSSEFELENPQISFALSGLVLRS